MTAPAATSTAGWVFVALCFAGPVARGDVAAWSHLVATADWINHGVLRYEELIAGVKVLVALGLVEEVQGTVRVTRGARRWLKATYGSNKRMSVFKLWARADTLISTRSAGPARWRAISRPFFDRAVQAYADRMRGMMAR
jgi:hypothetical protein